MPTKAYGRDIREFYENHWPDGYCHEDSEIEFYDDAGKWILEDDKKYQLSKLGYLEPSGGDSRRGALAFETEFSVWYDRLGKETIVIRVSTEAKEAIIRELKNLGAEIL